MVVLGRVPAEVTPMTKKRNVPRKTKRIVRTPATSFAHLQKRIKRRPKDGTGKAKRA